MCQITDFLCDIWTIASRVLLLYTKVKHRRRSIDYFLFLHKTGKREIIRGFRSTKFAGKRMKMEENLPIIKGAPHLLRFCCYHYFWVNIFVIARKMWSVFRTCFFAAVACSISVIKVCKYGNVSMIKKYILVPICWTY